MPPGEKMTSWFTDAAPTPSVTVVGPAVGRCSTLTNNVAAYLDERREGDVERQCVAPGGGLSVNQVADLVVFLCLNVTRLQQDTLQEALLRPVVTAMVTVRDEFGRNGEQCVVIGDDLDQRRREDAYEAVTGSASPPLTDAVVVTLRNSDIERISETALAQCKQL